MSTYTKPQTKYQPSDWFTNQFAISTNSERQQEASGNIRQEARFLRNETDNKSYWDEYDTRTRLADRIDAVRKWKEIMEETKDELDKEIEALDTMKNHAEEALWKLNESKDVNTECLVARDGRREIDLVEDELEHQLNKEQEIIRKVKKNLQQKIDECFEKQCLLHEARQHVVDHIQDKHVTMDIDIEQYNMNGKTHITYKPNSKRIHKKAVTPQQWEDITRYTVNRAKAEKQDSERLREATHFALHKADNDLDAQNNATNYALRKRIHELERAKDELEWQKKNLEDEMDNLEKDLQGIEDAIKAKIPLLTKAETRAENRQWRPNQELCMDAAQYGLNNEIQQLYATKKALEEKQAQGRHALDNLDKQLYRVNNDIACKNNSLMLDGMCVDSRKRLDPSPTTRTDCNLLTQGITRIENKVLS